MGKGDVVEMAKFEKVQLNDLFMLVGWRDFYSRKSEKTFTVLSFLYQDPGTTGYAVKEVYANEYDEIKFEVGALYKLHFSFISGNPRVSRIEFVEG